MPISKTQIDRLGDRLKGGIQTESDLRLLDDYRRSFGDAYEAVLRTVLQSGKFPTGRLAKSNISIVEKLRRESIRLSQIQDIAGCRVVVADIAEQEQFVASLIAAFPHASVVDRRANPSHDYRAVHIVAEISGKLIEILVRSALQHLWAEVSEKSSDVLDPAIKYGGGAKAWREFLTGTSKLVASYGEFYQESEKQCVRAAASWNVYLAAHEELKKAIAEQLQRQLTDHEAQEFRGMLEDERRATERLEQDDLEIQEVRVRERARQWNVLAEVMNRAISLLDKLKRQKP